MAAVFDYAIGGAQSASGSTMTTVTSAKSVAMVALKNAIQG